MDLVSKFSERLKELIFDNKITIEKLSNDIDCNARSIYEWQSDNQKYLPSLKNLIKLADYFRCSLDFLLGIEGNNSLPNPKPRPLFSEHFRPAVESKGFTLHGLMKATQIDTNNFYKWINGKGEPSLDSLLRIAAVLDCSLDYLVGRE